MRLTGQGFQMSNRSVTSSAVPTWARFRRGGARAGIGLVLGMIATSPSFAATIMGSGVALSCGGWVEVRKTPNKTIAEEWTLGYLSGVAMWTPASPLDGLDVGAVMVWLDNFCQQRPLLPYKAALDEFVRQRTAAMQQQQQQQQQGIQQRPAQAPAAPAPAPQNRR